MSVPAPPSRVVSALKLVPKAKLSFAVPPVMDCLVAVMIAVNLPVKALASTVVKVAASVVPKSKFWSPVIVNDVAAAAVIPVKVLFAV